MFCLSVFLSVNFFFLGLHWVSMQSVKSQLGSVAVRGLFFGKIADNFYSKIKNGVDYTYICTSFYIFFLLAMRYDNKIDQLMF